MTASSLAAVAGPALVVVATAGMLIPGPSRAADRAAVSAIVLPADPSTYRPGPGAALAVANCSACHGASYVYTQPKLTRKQWAAEVTKMRKAYGAPVPDDAVPALVDYLVAQNGRE